MAKKREYLTDKQWEKIAPLLPDEKPGPQGGRRRRGNREVLEAILWILRTGARWQDLPERYPSPSTCGRRLKDWEERDIWLEVWRTFLGELDAEGVLDWEEAFVDASFAPAKKGALASGPPRGGRAQSGWWWSTARVFLWEANWPRPRRRR